MALKLIKKAKLTEVDYKLVLSGIDLIGQKGKLYAAFKDRMLQMLSNSMGDVTGKGDEAFVAQHQHQVLVAQGWRPPKKGYSKPYQQKYQGGQSKEYKSRRDDKGTNPIGASGKMLLCHVCQSKNHLLRDCPQSYENGGRQQNSKGQNRRWENKKSKVRHAMVVEYEKSSDSEVEQSTEGEYERESAPRSNRGREGPKQYSRDTSR